MHSTWQSEDARDHAEDVCLPYTDGFNTPKESSVNFRYIRKPFLLLHLPSAHCYYSNNQRPCPKTKILSEKKRGERVLDHFCTITSLEVSDYKSYDILFDFEESFRTPGM